jgi:hypothetical protein
VLRVWGERERDSEISAAVCRGEMPLAGRRICGD